MSALHANTFGFEVVVIGAVDCGLEGKRFTWYMSIIRKQRFGEDVHTRQNRPIEFGVGRDFDESDVGWKLVACFDVE